MTLETYNKIREEIKRIQNPIRTCVVDEEEIVSHEDTAGDARGDDNQRSSDSTGQLTIETAANAHVDETSVADAQINTEGDGEMTATERLKQRSRNYNQLLLVYKENSQRRMN